MKPKDVEMTSSLHLRESPSQWRIKWFSARHGSRAVILALGWWKQNNQEFKASLHHRMSLRQAWAIKDSPLILHCLFYHTLSLWNWLALPFCIIWCLLSPSQSLKIFCSRAHNTQTLDSILITTYTHVWEARICNPSTCEVRDRKVRSSKPSLTIV